MNLKKPELKSTRQGYGEALLEIGKDERIVVLTADLTESTKTDLFEKKYPERFLQCGVAEQNMVGMAAGLALSGKIPFASTFAAFIPNRALDQVRVSVCYNNANVKFGITHAGLTVGEDGATHQALEDIATMRVLPNMTVIVPCDYEEAKKATKEAAKITGPVYLRLGRSNIPIITNSNSSFKIGKAEILKTGKDVTIIACGIMVYEALIAAEELSKNGINAEVINCHTIKPIDEKMIVGSAKKTGALVSAEEHQVNGGLGSAVAEVLAKNSPTPMEFVGVKNVFGESGKSEELLKKYGLTHKEIITAAKKVIKRK
ncbi:MAG: transketolase family protein [Nanoarchaeota archaeon]|nr:transketolase family protein [Nanoarchaeota archaeon]MBU1270482.1 transketolase family protein [Nanoarchaeota archaeon]MBU1603695.1 transketolase family protein [Nanoarchaeota archaeon]MBU2443710.1 transketolase family protein [Nanoarchaeota archaeon]